MRYLLFAFSIIVSVTAFAQSPSENTLTKTDSIPATGSTVKIDSADLYGYIPERPIKVGEGPPEQRKYLESLRDAQGKKVKYERLESCCAYPSENALIGGMALLDKYEIIYRDEINEKQKAVLYISFYDYEKPKAVKGFTIE